MFSSPLRISRIFLKFLSSVIYEVLYVRGVALVAISEITLSNDNYNVTVALLKEKFGNLDSIIEMLYSKLQNLPTALNRFSRFSDVKRAHGNISSSSVESSGRDC